MVRRHPRFLSTYPRNSMVTISAICPIFITGPTQFAGMSTTPPASRGPRKVKVQKKKLWWTAASTKVTRNRTNTNGCRSNFIAFNHASESPAEAAGFGGVCGRVRLYPARTSDATPDTRKMYRFAAEASAPVFEVAKTVPSQSPNESEPKSGTRAQSTRMKMNGHDAAIQPIVPHTRI